MDSLPLNVSHAYSDLANDPRYKHFVRIPDRIIRCIDYFGVACDHSAVRAKLHAYYLFIGVVDEAIDSSCVESGKLILEYLSSPAPEFSGATEYSRARLMAEILKFHISHGNHREMMDRLRNLYEEVVSERNAISIDSYIDHRKSVGALTAESSYLLIRSSLDSDNDSLCEFMRQVGAIGCLTDSLIDLNRDRRLGLLGFNPRPSDYARLVLAICRNGIRVSLRHPRLCGLFLRAIGDNLRDPFRPAPTLPQSSFASDRKKEAASVA
jgi:hypothetical protein